MESEHSWPPVNICGGNCPFVNYLGGYSGGCGGGGAQYECLAAKHLENIDRSLSALCALLESISVPRTGSANGKKQNEEMTQNEKSPRK